MELKNQEAWVGINNTMFLVHLLVLIQDLQYNKLDKKRSIMTTVEADFDPYSCAQRRQ